MEEWKEPKAARREDRFPWRGGMTNDFRHNEVDDKDVPEDVKTFEAGVVEGMGDGGAAVKLTAEEKEQESAVEKRWAFNKIASDKVSLWRRLNDIRGGECQKLDYDDDLPSASVIIIFNNLNNFIVYCVN